MNRLGPALDKSPAIVKTQRPILDNVASELAKAQRARLDNVVAVAAVARREHALSVRGSASGVHRSLGAQTRSRGALSSCLPERRERGQEISLDLLFHDRLSVA